MNKKLFCQVTSIECYYGKEIKEIGTLRYQNINFQNSN